MILFGAGDIGRQALKLFGLDRVAYFCDNYLSDNVIDDIMIIPYAKLKEIHQDYEVIITTEKLPNICSIVIQLMMDGIPFQYYKVVANKCIETDADIYSTLCHRDTLIYDSNMAYFISTDKTKDAGNLGSYFWQDLWAARHIFTNKPEVHYDIGSRIDGFIAHLASFNQKVRLLDLRPMKSSIPGVEFTQCDATNMEQIPDDSIESLSALCSLEHFGLGRYGDKIDPEACFKCFKAIVRKLQIGGVAYISVPIGKEHLEFNAHRVFFASTIKESFLPLVLEEFSSTYKDTFETNIDIHKYDAWTEWGGERFGLFRFRKS